MFLPVIKYRILQLSILLLSSSCTQSIKQGNKIAIIGKIVKPSIAKNGKYIFVYFYHNTKFLDFASFDARRFTFGDKFLLFIDKDDPKKNEMPKPKVRLGTFDDIVKDSSITYYDNTSDMDKLDSIPTY